MAESAYDRARRFSQSEDYHEQRAIDVEKNAKQATAQGWTPAIASNFKCAWCGDSMADTEPHEMLNKTKDYSGKTLVGMHDECYGEARRDDPDNCSECGLPVTTPAEKAHNVHGRCIDVS